MGERRHNSSADHARCQAQQMSGSTPLPSRWAEWFEGATPSASPAESPIRPALPPVRALASLRVNAPLSATKTVTIKSRGARVNAQNDVSPRRTASYGGDTGTLAAGGNQYRRLLARGLQPGGNSRALRWDSGVAGHDTVHQFNVPPATRANDFEREAFKMRPVTPLALGRRKRTGRCRQVCSETVAAKRAVNQWMNPAALTYFHRTSPARTGLE